MTLINGFTRPAFDASFEIMKAATRAGVGFTTVNLPNNDTTNWSVQYTATSVLVNVLGTGDFNHDNVVDAADYVVWCKTPASYGGAGGYDTWRRNFGNVISGNGSSLGTAQVPEPGTIALLGIALIALVNPRRRCYSSARFLD